MIRIASIAGDGIGTEVTPVAQAVLKAAAARFGIDVSVDEWPLGADRYLREGITITDDEFETLSDEYDALFLGALGDPRVPDNAHARDILLGFRFRLDLYVNYRPCVLLDPALCPLRGYEETPIAIHTFRENTEGLYANLGGRMRTGTEHEIAIQESVNTWRAVERIVRAAFVFARDRGLARVTLVDKANALPAAGALWRRAFDTVGEEFPAVRQDKMYVDALAMDLVRRPEAYEVLVTSNLFGDILSDLAAELTGGLGLAPSANVHPGRHALFEPVHGSAPDIAGQGKANPIGAVRSIGLLLDHFGHAEAAQAVDRAVRASMSEGATTADLGGDLTTEQAGRWLVDYIGSMQA